jgi:hypothetical protein
LKVFLYLSFVGVGGSDTSNNDRNNVETQRKGIVVVGFSTYMYKNNELENDDRQSNSDLGQWTKDRMEANACITNVAPLRVAAAHVCLRKKYMFKVLESFYGFTIKAMNARTKIHFGNPIEMRYKLQEFGKC